MVELRMQKKKSHPRFWKQPFIAADQTLSLLSPKINTCGAIFLDLDFLGGYSEIPEG